MNVHIPPDGDPAAATVDDPGSSGEGSTSAERVARPADGDVAGDGDITDDGVVVDDRYADRDGNPRSDVDGSAEQLVDVAGDQVRNDAVSDDALHDDAARNDALLDDASHSNKVWYWRELSRKRAAGKPKRPWWVELPILLVCAFILTFLIQTFVARVYYVPSGSMEHTLHGVTSGGDRILAFKMIYDFRSPRQGEVVVFKGPPTWTPEANIPGPTSWIGKVGQAIGSVVGIAPPNEKDFVKRVIAVGGQTISCCDVQGRVQVDGQSLNEPYLFMEEGNPIHAQWQWTVGQTTCDPDPADPGRYQSVRCFGPYTVPEGMVWVMGDHRPESADSSYQCRGLAPAPNVHCQGPIPVDDVIGKVVAIVMPPSRWGGVSSPDIMPAVGSAK